MQPTTPAASTLGSGSSSARAKAKRINVTIWTVQIILACLFLFSGSMKLVMPLAALTAQMPVPGFFVRFLGVAEVAGALGLILPSLLHIRPWLTPIAAGGLVIIMSGATGVTMAIGKFELAFIPFAIGVLAGAVAYARTRVSPIRERSRGSRRARYASNGFARG